MIQKIENPAGGPGFQGGDAHDGTDHKYHHVAPLSSGNADALINLLPSIPSCVPDLKPESATSLCGPCPKCGGKDRFFYKTDVDRFACRGCHPEQGDLIEFHLWRDGVSFADLVQQHIKPESTAGRGDYSRYREIITYLVETRKIPIETVHDAIDGGKIWQQMYNDKPAVAARYSSIDGNGKAKRTIQYIPLDGSEKKFKKGSVAREDIFILGSIKNGDGEIILVESVINALTIKAKLPGSTVIALGGSTFTRKVEFLQGYDVICCFDHDDAGKKATAVVEKILGKCRGVQWAADIPEKFDVNDLLKAGRGDEIRNMIKNAVLVESADDTDQEPAENAIIGLNVADFLGLDLPPREFIINPILPQQGLATLYGPRGMGKTYVLLTLAAAVATGRGALKWTVPAARRVLYIDGEMPARTMQERIARILVNSDADDIDPAFFQIITPDLNPEYTLNLSREADQRIIDKYIEAADLIIIDSLSTLARHGEENRAESWLPVQEYLLKLRRRGKAVILAHHAGKNGQQRGTSAKEDILDTVIALKRPKDYREEEGARFEVKFEKARGVCGDDVKSFEAKLEQDGNRLFWTCRDIEDVRLEQVRAMHEDGLTVREIADELGISKSAAHRLIKKI